MIGEVRQVLVDAPGRGRTVHEAPEIDGIVRLPADTVAGELIDMEITGAIGPDLTAVRTTRTTTTTTTVPAPAPATSRTVGVPA
jgi:hypothetical protein